MKILLMTVIGVMCLPMIHAAYEISLFWREMWRDWRISRKLKRKSEFYIPD